MNDEEIRRVLSDDPRGDAERAGLHYVDDRSSGYRRLRCGTGFTFRDDAGRTVQSPRLRARFNALAIPPAWEDVWIGRDPRGHLLATGIDDAGRRQYLYHPQWREIRDAVKFRRMLGFGRLLPRIRTAVRRDLRRDGIERRRVLAAIVRLLESSLARIGHDEYAEGNGTYGLATLRKRHVTMADRGTLTIAFTGKSNQDWVIEVADPRVVSVVGDCMQAPGHELFKYADGGRPRRVSAYDVLGYLGEVSGHAVHAKDFRTWAGTVLAAKTLDAMRTKRPHVERKRIIVRTVEQVAEELRNTAAVCRASYICPAVLESFDPELVARSVAAVRKQLPGLRREEATVLAFLDRCFAPRDPWIVTALAA